MNQQELERLIILEKRIKELAQEFGLSIVEIDFELVSPQRMMEGIAYRLPVNFSHWSRGRDYERYKTVFDFTGGGLAYEIVWNFKHPRALLMNTNPLILNVLTIAHVYGHVDFNLRNIFTSQGREIADMALEAKHAIKRFEEYEKQYGKEQVEKVVEAGFSLEWLQDPNPLAQEMDEEVLRERLLEILRAKLKKAKGSDSELIKKASDNEIRRLQTAIKKLKHRTPPEPTYDILGYIIRHSSKIQKNEWQYDVLSVIRDQARSFARQMRTKLLNEGWATHWHAKIMNRLFEENLLDSKEHEIYTKYHTAVLRESRSSINWYLTGTNLFQYIKERWDKGQFGKDWEEEKNSNIRSHWDTGAMLGNEKIFKVSQNFTDRMAIEEFFTNDFIHHEKLYIYAEMTSPLFPDEIVYVIAEDNPEVIRRILVDQHTNYGSPLITVEDGNYGNKGELYLKHQFSGFELDPIRENGALEYIYLIWGKPVHFETIEIEESSVPFKQMKAKRILHSYDGKEHRMAYIDNRSGNPKHPQ